MNYFFEGAIHQFPHVWQITQTLLRPFGSYLASVLWLEVSALVCPRAVWLAATVGAITPDVYRSFSLGWIYFYKSIQICFCAASCTRGVNVLYKVFRSGIRPPPSPPIPSVNSLLSPGHSSFWQLQIRQLFFLQRLQNVDKCPCDGCVCFKRRTQILFHWPPTLLATKLHQVEHGKKQMSRASPRPNACVFHPFNGENGCTWPCAQAGNCDPEEVVISGTILWVALVLVNLEWMFTR